MSIFKRLKKLEQKRERDYDMITALWIKHDRLLEHLGLEDVVIAEKKVIRKTAKLKGEKSVPKG